MRILTVLSLALMMTACGESAPTETVESLIADPERLAELREQCRDNPAALGDPPAFHGRWRRALYTAGGRTQVLIQSIGVNIAQLIDMPQHAHKRGVCPARAPVGTIAFSPRILLITVFDRH